MDIRSDRQKGLSYVELGRKYHMDPRTAKRYAESPQKPGYTLAHKDGPVQTDRGRVAGGGAVFGAADSGEAAGDGV